MEVVREEGMPHAGVDNKVATKELVPDNTPKPKVFDQAESSCVAPAAERASEDHQADRAVQTTCPIKTSKWNPISPGLSSVMLPLGPAPNKRPTEERDNPLNPTTEAAPAKAAPVLEAKVGSIVELFMGRGQVRAIREDGILELVAVGWEMVREQRARYYVRKESVKVVPTVYYKMPVLEQLHMAAWLKEEGGRLFKAGEYQAAGESYRRAIEVLSTSSFTSNTQIARALEMMIPCYNNAATCYIKVKNYGDARLLAENVDRLYSTLKHSRSGSVAKTLKGRGVGEAMLWEWWQTSLLLNGKACILQCQEDFDAMSLGKELITPTKRSKRLREITQELFESTESLASKMKKLEQLVPSDGRPIRQLSILDSIAKLAQKDDEVAKELKDKNKKNKKAKDKKDDKVAKELKDKNKKHKKAKDKKKDEVAKELKDKKDDEKLKDKKKEHDTALPMHNLLRGTLVVSIMAAYIVGLLMLGKRR